MVYELAVPAPVQDAPTYDRLEVRRVTILLGSEPGILVEWTKHRGDKKLGTGRTMFPLATLGAVLETTLLNKVYDALIARNVIPPGGLRR